MGTDNRDEQEILVIFNKLSLEAQAAFKALRDNEHDSPEAIISGIKKLKNVVQKPESAQLGKAAGGNYDDDGYRDYSDYYDYQDYSDAYNDNFDSLKGGNPHVRI